MNCVNIRMHGTTIKKLIHCLKITHVRGEEEKEDIRKAYGKRRNGVGYENTKSMILCSNSTNILCWYISILVV